MYKYYERILMKNESSVEYHYSDLYSGFKLNTSTRMNIKEK